MIERAVIALLAVGCALAVGRALHARWRAELQRRAEEHAARVAELALQLPTRPFIWTGSKTQEDFDRAVERFNDRARRKLLRCERPKLPPAPREPLHTEGPFR